MFVPQFGKQNLISEIVLNIHMKSILTDLGVASCLVRNNQILLVKEAAGPQKGLWGIPKGSVDKGELPYRAAVRELKEECGINGSVIGLVGVRECLIQNLPAVFLAYLIDCESSKIIIDKKEIEDFGWFNMNDFDSLRWISEAMKEIAAEAIIGRSRKLIDYSEEKGSDYLLYL
jgi:ADP-ribose pyrophosphatase YjhB (NUDIX family)|tara:strand:- start:1583 stop:2104 length:522 start_codon:yes stop_codon:yes gene_type:complete